MTEWNHDSFRSKKVVSWSTERPRQPTSSDRLFSDTEVDDMVLESERSLRNLRQSSLTLRQELETLTQKRRALRSLQISEKEVPESRPLTVSRIMSSHPQIEESTSEADSTHQETLREVDLEGRDSLALEDIVSSAEVVDFMNNYLPEKTKVTTEEFCSCLELEFPELMKVAGMREELAAVLSVDQDHAYLSLNALEVFTKNQSLSSALSQLADSLEAAVHAEKQEVNAEIVSELTAINSILEKKTQDLDHRESDLNAQIKEHQIMKNRLFDMLQTELERLAEESLQEIKTKAQAQVKKMQKMERNLMENLKLLKTKKDAIEKAKPDPEKAQAETIRLKARIQGLEKTTEHLKAKNSALETEVASDKTQLQKLSEDLGRLKAKNQHLEQQIQDYKSQKIREIEAQKTIETESQAVPPPSIPEAKDPESVSGSPEISVLLSIFGILVSGLRDILPLYLGAGGRGSMDLSPMSSVRSSLAVGENIGFGKLLYPTFNALVPKLVESLPIVVKAKRQDALQQTVALLHAMVSHTYIEHLQPESTLQYPQLIEFLPSIDFWRKKGSKRGKKPMETSGGTPLYQLFSNPEVQKTAVVQFCRFLSPQEMTDSEVVLSIQSALLTLLLSGSKKRIDQALRHLKSSVSESRSKAKSCEFLLKDPSNSLVVLISAMQNPDPELAALACQVFLILSMHTAFSKCALTFAAATNDFEVNS